MNAHVHERKCNDGTVAVVPAVRMTLYLLPICSGLISSSERASPHTTFMSAPSSDGPAILTNFPAILPSLPFILSSVPLPRPLFLTALPPLPPLPLPAFNSENGGGGSRGCSNSRRSNRNYKGRLLFQIIGLRIQSPSRTALHECLILSN